MDREFTEDDTWTVISDRRKLSMDLRNQEESKSKDKVGIQPNLLPDNSSKPENQDKEPINSRKSSLDASSDEEVKEM